MLDDESAARWATPRIQTREKENRKMKTSNATQWLHDGGAARRTRSTVVPLMLSLILGAFWAVPFVAAGNAVGQASLDRWIADGGYYTGAYQGGNTASLTAGPEIDRASVDRWASQGGYYAGAFGGGTSLSVVAAAPQSDLSDVDRWAANGGYYQGAYHGASRLSATLAFAPQAEEADLHCWALGAGYYATASDTC
jgi:hypothetical protein